MSTATKMKVKVLPVMIDTRARADRRRVAIVGPKQDSNESYFVG